MWKEVCWKSVEQEEGEKTENARLLTPNSIRIFPPKTSRKQPPKNQETETPPRNKKQKKAEKRDGLVVHLNIPDGEHRSLDWATQGEVKALERHGGKEVKMTERGEMGERRRAQRRKKIERV